MTKKKIELPTLQVAGKTAVLIFDLNEEQSAYDCAYHGMDWALVAFDLDQHLRGLLKYGHKFKDADEALEAIREELHNLITDKGVDLDMIT